MVSILFWNVAKNPVADLIAEACLETGCDILLLAEYDGDGLDILSAVNGKLSTTPFKEFRYGIPKVNFFTRIPLTYVEAIYDSSYVSIRNVKPIIGAPLLIVAAHLRSKREAETPDQRILAGQVVAAIESAEQKVGHQYTLVIGDFNMHPFDEGLISAEGFHAVSSRIIASKGSRRVGDSTYQFFYNPFWGRLGDDTPGPPGTFYLNRGGSINHYWNSFDQVLVRPPLFPYFKSSDLQVLTSIGGQSLLKNDQIDKTISDHLPIKITLSPERQIAS